MLTAPNLPTQYNAKAEVFTLAILLWEMTQANSLTRI